MERQSVERVIDSVLEGFELSAESSQVPWKDRGTVSFWIPKTYKEKYERIQTKSRRKFSKKVQEAIMLMIDQVDLEEETTA